MRDKHFVAEHRGGLLKKEQHRQLIIWACNCAEHVLPLYGEKIDDRLIYALFVAREWELENATVGEARKASVGAIAVANESSNPKSQAIARAVGHAVATAHMADHSIIAAVYSLKALKYDGQNIETEKTWQIEQLQKGIKGLILSSIKKK